jgi:hypothetical protein
MLTTKRLRVETNPVLTTPARRLAAALANGLATGLANGLASGLASGLATAIGLFAATSLGACVDEAPGTRVEIRSLERDGIHWTISGLDASIEHEQIEAIAKYVEMRTKPEGVMVRVMKSDAGDSVLMITLAGPSVNDDGLEAAVREQFPTLNGAKFSRSTGAAPDIGPMPPVPSLPDLTFVEHDKDAPSEEMEAEIRDALSAHGVEGHVDVKVEGDGTQREVRVEVRQEAKRPMPAPTK